MSTELMACREVLADTQREVADLMNELHDMRKNLALERARVKDLSMTIDATHSLLFTAKRLTSSAHALVSQKMNDISGYSGRLPSYEWGDPKDDPGYCEILKGF